MLAFDVAKSPHRYGFWPDDAGLWLLAYTFGSPEKKKAELGPLVKALRKVADKSGLEVGLAVVKCPLKSYPARPFPAGGMKTLCPSVGVFEKDREVMPYTPGLHLWLASLACPLIAAETRGVHRAPQAFFGFQGEAPEWAEYDAGKEGPHDTSPEFLQALTRATEAAGTPIEFRAPWNDWRLDRYMIVRLGLELRVPFHLTSSCIQGWKADCGVCSQCMKRNIAFRCTGITCR